MKLRIWCKTVLSVYGYLPKITDSIDKVVQSVATAKYLSSVDFLLQAKKIIGLTERKINLINLKILVENVLAQIEQREARALVLKFCDNLSAEEVSLALCCSNRTVFRLIASGIAKMQKSLIAHGYTSAKFEQLYGKELWIKEKFDYILMKENNMCENAIFCRDIKDKDFFKYALNIV